MPDETERPHLDRGRVRPSPSPKPALQPGEKQPAHEDPKQLRESTVKALNDFASDIGATETYESSAERAKRPGNLNPTPPEERTPPLGTAIRAPADIAAAHLAAATTAIEVNETAERQLKSDPRFERDQKVFEMGQRGKLGLVPPSEAEQAVMAQRAGISEEAAEKIPTTAQEQVDEDMERLAVAEERDASGVTGTAPAPSGMPIPVGGQNSPTTEDNTSTSGSGAVRQSPVKPAEQEMGIPPNNLEKARQAGMRIGGAEGRAQTEEERKNANQAKTDAQGDTVIK